MAIDLSIEVGSIVQVTRAGHHHEGETGPVVAVETRHGHVQVFVALGVKGRPLTHVWLDIESVTRIAAAAEEPESP